MMLQARIGKTYRIVAIGLNGPVIFVHDPIFGRRWRWLLLLDTTTGRAIAQGQVVLFLVVAQLRVFNSPVRQWQGIVGIRFDGPRVVGLDRRQAWQDIRNARNLHGFKVLLENAIFVITVVRSHAFAVHPWIADVAVAKAVVGHCIVVVLFVYVFVEVAVATVVRLLAFVTLSFWFYASLCLLFFRSSLCVSATGPECSYWTWCVLKMMLLISRMEWTNSLVDVFLMLVFFFK